ncbi:hypothetical protein DPMN_005022 [Dreissena polymorpha]|uniref:RING-type domain-containing protein n=1 Tax=Dreissena polymorpha TaxID=45954 RepID=A0A9D4RW41_DREPO|nr:hypothetical protein DPMN_005022 [Dreissena polymorpha]
MAYTAELTQCHICLEQFQKPRALPCVHTFCHLCLQEYINACHSRAGLMSGFKCPVCRKETRPTGNDVPTDPANWASLFPINHLIVSLMDGLPGASDSKKESSTSAPCREAIGTTGVEVPAFVHDVDPHKGREQELSYGKQIPPSTSVDPYPIADHYPSAFEYHPHPNPFEHNSWRLLDHHPPPPFGHHPPPPFGHHPPPPFGHHPTPPFGHQPPPPFGHHPTPPHDHHRPPPSLEHHHPRFGRPHSPPHHGHHHGHRHGHPGCK